MMEDRYMEEDVRKRLVLAGLDEICKHGVRDFSLRRVALAAQVSCAAPYRHFKGKEELIGGIIEYISSKWQLLCQAIEGAHANDPARLASELAIANIRFWLANGNFRTVLMSGSDNPDFARLMSAFDSSMLTAVEKHLLSLGKSPTEVAEKQFAIRSLIYGTVLLISSGRVENTPENIAIVKKKIEAELQ